MRVERGVTIREGPFITIGERELVYLEYPFSCLVRNQVFLIRREREERQIALRYGLDYLIPFPRLKGIDALILQWPDHSGDSTANTRIVE